MQHPNWDYNSDFDAPDGWEWVVVVENPNDDGNLTVTLDHEKVLAAVRRIAEFGVKHVSDKCIEQCRRLLSADWDDTDFDADLADQVLQVAALGECPYS
jgi:hypothetical protein